MRHSKQSRNFALHSLMAKGINDLRRLEVANKWMALHIRRVANHFLETDSFTFQNGGRFFTAGLSGNRVDLRGAN